MTGKGSSFQKVIDELTSDEGRELSRRTLQEFSDIDPASLRAMQEAWPRLSTARKRQLLEGLQSLSETDTLVSFDDFARSLLGDPDPQVRLRAIRLLDESDDTKLIPALIRMLADGRPAPKPPRPRKFVGLAGWRERRSSAPGGVPCWRRPIADPQVRRNALEALRFARPSHHPDQINLTPGEPGMAGRRPVRREALVRRTLGRPVLACWM
jgi:HEAT repeat protein